MSEARDSRQAIYGQNLLTLIDDIKPENLGQRSHSQYVKQIERALRNSLLFDSDQFILLIESIKNCKKPCYRRDLLLEVLDLIIFSDDTFSKILCHSVRQWKEFANSIVMLPDLIANSKMLDKYINFKADSFYSITLVKVYEAIKTVKPRSIEQQWFYLQIIGRIALSGFNQLVWEKITSRAIKENCESTRKSMMEILVIPLSTDKFESFVEPLYIPIFFYLRPRVSSGRLIHSVIGDRITSNEELEYIICNKSTLQTNYLHDRNRQSAILFNIFSYLSYVDPSLLIKTLLEITNSWSHGTKVMMRPYEQSRFISCALVIAFRYASECSREDLAKVANQIQSTMMKGVSNYLNRASYEHRNLAMCLCEIIFPKLYEIIHGSPGNIKLEFEVDWIEDCLQIKRLFNSEISELFSVEDDYKEVRQDISGNIDLNKAKEDSDHSVDEDEFDCDDTHSVPIYLRDCINGLVENKTPRYVRLCLIKANELIRQSLKELETPSDSDTIRDYAIELAQILLHVDNEFNLESFDSHRIRALSSLCVASPDLVVKYLLDKFNGPNMSIRLKLDILQAAVASANELTSQRGKTNKFAKYACLYFYGIVYKLNSSGAILPSTLKSLRDSSNFDDSYLLSRILFSISLIIRCLDQQPITCKLSNDLLDILAAYRCHPDSGVRKTIVSCLSVIRDCTPKVYFKEYLHDKTMCLFGTWLANQSELIKLSRS